MLNTQGRYINTGVLETGERQFGLFSEKGVFANAYIRIFVPQAGTLRALKSPKVVLGKYASVPTVELLKELFATNLYISSVQRVDLFQLVPAVSAPVAFRLGLVLEEFIYDPLSITETTKNLTVFEV